MHSRQPHPTLEERVQLKAFGHPGVLMIPQVLSISKSLILQHQLSIWLQETLFCEALKLSAKFYVLVLAYVL